MMLVINPFSGRGISKSALGTIVSQLCGNGYIITVYFAGEHTPEQLAYDYAKHHELVVCVGGDGTLSSVVCGLLRSGASVPVGYIPNGTANDIAATLTLSRDPSTAAQAIINGSPRPLDIGLFSDRYFTYIAAFGAFTSVSHSTPQNAKRALGHFAYVLGGLADVAAIKARRTVVEYDGGVIEGDFIFGGVANSTSVAGFVKLDPERVDLADGMFEVILVKQPIIMADFLDIMAGLVMQTYDGDNVQLLHASKVKFTFDEDVAWTVDGEDGGLHRQAEITNCHKAIEIIV
jgi:YegS/Rv2252/BmrU family lipid kinase